MNDMTEEQRKKFIEKRVKSILDNHAELGRALDSMTPAQRDIYVHRRAEIDLVINEAIQNKLDDHLHKHWVTYLHIFIFDIFALAIVLALVAEAWGHVLVFPTLVAVLSAFAVSRYLNYRMNKSLSEITDLVHRQFDRAAQTTTLDYLVDRIEIEDDITKEVLNTTEVGGAE